MGIKKKIKNKRLNLFKFGKQKSKYNIVKKSVDLDDFEENSEAGGVSPDNFVYLIDYGLAHPYMKRKSQNQNNVVEE